MTENKILVIRGGAIGDFILTLPVLAALRENFPGSRLELLGYPHIAALAGATGLVDAIRPVESRPLAGYFARKNILDADLAVYFGSCAIILSYLYDPDSIFQENVKSISKAQFIQGPHKPSETGPLHATEALLKPLERLAIFAPDPIPKLPIQPGVLEQIASGRWIAIHPGSGSETKNWPVEHWRTLAHETLAHTTLNLLIVGGEAEGSRLDLLAATLPQDRILVARGLPLPELSRWLAGCALFIGHDSGITHLAAATGIPVIALWGPTNHHVWSPRNPGVTLLGLDGGLSTVLPHHVLEAITARFSSIP